MTLSNFDEEIEKINTVFPQIQCQKCGYSGCKPYAKAILEGEKISLCAPGGIDVLNKLAKLLDQDPVPYLPEVTDHYFSPKLPFIREEECIGCTKCLQVCPTDAIVGAAKMIHTIIPEDCTGCELCITACPVDCISEGESSNTISNIDNISKQAYFKKLHELKNERSLKKKEKKIKYDSQNIKFEIEQSLLRYKQKKLMMKNNESS